LVETAAPPGAAHETPTSRLYLIHPAHGHVILTHTARGDVSVLDLTSNTTVKRIPTSPAPNYTLITREGDRAYVSNSGNNTITEIDVATWAPLRTLEAGPSPEHMIFSSDEQSLYVT